MELGAHGSPEMGRGPTMDVADSRRKSLVARRVLQFEGATSSESAGVEEEKSADNKMEVDAQSAAWTRRQIAQGGKLSISSSDSGGGSASTQSLRAGSSSAVPLRNSRFKTEALTSYGQIVPDVEIIESPTETRRVAEIGESPGKNRRVAEIVESPGQSSRSVEHIESSRLTLRSADRIESSGTSIRSADRIESSRRNSRVMEHANSLDFETRSNSSSLFDSYELDVLARRIDSALQAEFSGPAPEEKELIKLSPTQKLTRNALLRLQMPGNICKSIEDVVTREEISLGVDIQRCECHKNRTAKISKAGVWGFRKLSKVFQSIMHLPDCEHSPESQAERRHAREHFHPHYHHGEGEYDYRENVHYSVKFGDGEHKADREGKPWLSKSFVIVEDIVGGVLTGRRTALQRGLSSWRMCVPSLSCPRGMT